MSWRDQGATRLTTTSSARTGAIRVVTLDAACAMFFDDKVGSLEVGKYADLVELEGNPHSIDPAKIPQIKVMATWVEGKPAYTGGKAGS